VPQRELDLFWREAAVQIGGAVQASVLHRREQAHR